MEEIKMCPVSTVNGQYSCRKEECAWWVTGKRVVDGIITGEDFGECAIKNIAERLKK